MFHALAGCLMRTINKPGGKARDYRGAPDECQTPPRAATRSLESLSVLPLATYRILLRRVSAEMATRLPGYWEITWFSVCRACSISPSSACT